MTTGYIAKMKESETEEKKHKSKCGQLSQCYHSCDNKMQQ